MSEAHDTQREALAQPLSLREALRKARIETADRTGVVVDLRDAELARLEILNEALDPLFAQVPEQVDLFDRGISQGEMPRLWIDAVAHVMMGRDKRTYRFVQDTRFGRIVLAESHETPPIVEAVTDYVARRMIEREHALAPLEVPKLAEAAKPPPLPVAAEKPAAIDSRRRRGGFLIFVLGFILGALALFGAALLAAMGNM